MDAVTPLDPAADPPRGGGQRPGLAAVDVPRRSPLLFVVLVFLLSVPFWVAGLVTGGRLSTELPIGALMFVCPGSAALMLVYRDGGRGAAADLLRRSFDFDRITEKRWLLPPLLLGPVVYVPTYLLMRLTGVTVPDPQLPLLTALVVTAAFLVAGLAEELGWSGYAVDPLQARLGALGAGVVLGIVWTVWHLIPLMQAGRSAGWIAWWSMGTVAFRVLLTWVYYSSGRSVAAAAVCHGLTNLVGIGPFLDWGSDGYPLAGERISGLILAAAAAAVSIIWRARTLTGQGNRRVRRARSAA